jgi:hypothetical protein
MKMIYRQLPKQRHYLSPQRFPGPSLAVFFFSRAAYSLTQQLQRSPRCPTSK